jgi:hypothetical protein
MAMLRLRDIEVCYVRGDGEPIVTTLGEVDVESVVGPSPFAEHARTPASGIACVFVGQDRSRASRVAGPRH